MVPLFLKDVAARILFAKLGDTMLSGFISNLGALKLPPGIAPHVESVAFIPAPSGITLTNASMLSWNNDLVVTFGSLARSRELEKLFFRRLRKLGLSVSVRCRDCEE
jgi:glucose/arabinose dehydrogenase